MSKIRVCLVMSCLVVSASAQPNLLSSDSQTGAVMDWIPSENVSLEVTSERTYSAETAVKVTWQNVRELRGWAQKGNLLRSRDNVLIAPLKRDTRYRFHCWMFVEELEITPESRHWLAEYPDGMYDEPTVTIGCQGGAWNSGMPFAAYDISKPRTWQESSFEFVTPFNVGGGFSLHLDVYPCQGSYVRMCSSGTMFLEGVVLEECAARIGFTQTQRPITIDGKLDDWWETNPVVITRDQVVAGAPASNHTMRLAGTGHTWCEGAWEYYFLTGDRRSARKALGISNDLAYRIAGLCSQGAPGAAGARDFGWSVVGLMAAYRATADPLYLNAAREVEEVVVRTQHPFAGGWIKRFSTGHCFHATAHAGRVYFMQDIVLNGQVLFHQVTGDPDVQECIINACRGTMAEVRQRRAEGLPGLGYTSCPFLLTPGPWYPGRMKHGLDVPIRYLAMYYACGLPGGEKLANELFGLWPESGHLWSGSFPSQGKMFAQTSRWAPRLMHCIAQLPGAPNPATEQSAKEDK